MPYSLILLSFLLFFRVTAQQHYLFPIKPNQVNYLSASMGELRKSHFHGGIDIKTDKKQGLNVFASKDGYVYRIRVSPYGFGKVIYLRHPDSTFTVYAHLQSFTSALETYILHQQYAKKQFEVDIYPLPNVHTFKRGDIIGYSGNTGSSTAPHLHFEIRNSKDQTIDPQPFFYPQIQDNIAPIAQAILLAPLAKESRINGVYAKKIMYLTLQKGIYKYNTPIEAFATIGIAFRGYDKANYTHNVYGIKKAKLFVNKELVYSHSIEIFDYEEKTSINVYRDFDLWKKTGKNYQRLYIEKGNSLLFYAHSPTEGQINIEDGKTYTISIVIEDNFKNESQINFTIKGKKQSKTPKKDKQIEKVTLKGDMLKFNLPKIKSPQLYVYYGDSVFLESPAYSTLQSTVFLHKMNRKFPDSIYYNNKSLKLPSFATLIEQNKDQTHVFENFTFEFPKNAVFNNMFLTFKKSNSKSFSLGPEYTPLKNPVYITIQDSIFRDKSNMIVSQKQGTSWNTYPIKRFDDIIKFETKSLGHFRVIFDHEPPNIYLKKVTSKYISFTISDKSSGINRWEASINGAWLLMCFEPKSRLLWSKQLNNTKTLKGKFVLRVWDKTGNKKIYKRTL